MRLRRGRRRIEETPAQVKRFLPASQISISLLILLHVNGLRYISVDLSAASCCQSFTAKKSLCFTAVLYYSSFLFQKVISEVTESIPFILSHNIRSGRNLISHPQKLVYLYPHRKIIQNPQNWDFGDRVRH